MVTFRSMACIVSISLTMCVLQGGETLPADLWVAPGGSDENPGTKDQPFATLERARDAVRGLKKGGLNKDVTVLLRGGTYVLKEPLVFGPEDSGTDKYSITYAAAAGEKVILSGGVKITGWKHGKGETWTAVVPGVKEGELYFRQLWVNGSRAIRARTPNKDAAAPCRQLRGAGLSSDRKSHTYMFPMGQLAEWGNLADVEAVVFGNWEITRKRFQSVDLKAGGAQMDGPHRVPHDAIAPGEGRWYYIENALEFLDQPGEWYLDRPTGVLSYLPHPGEDVASAEAIAPRLVRLLEIKGTPERLVRNLHFKGIQFMHSDWSLPEGGYIGNQACHYTTGKVWSEGPWATIDAAIRWNYADGCSIENGALTHFGGCGIELVAGCTNNVIKGNHIFDISGNGVMLGGPTLEAEVPKDNRIADNYLHACGRDYYGSVGIWVGFAQRAAISHNVIHDLPYSGISLGWQWNSAPTPCRENTIECNHIYDVMNRLGDGGGIYTLGFQPGTVIRGNYIHDIHRSPLCQASPNNGMFIDEGSRGFLFENNVIIIEGSEPVRHNANSPAGHAWKDNWFGGSSTAPGKIGTALSCDGASTHVEAPNSAELEPEQFTLEAWILLKEYPGGRDTRRWIINKNQNEQADGHYALMVSADGVGAYLNVGGGIPNQYQAFSAKGALTLNEWHLLAATYDGATLKVFLNGKLAASTAVNKKRKPGCTPLDIGRRQDGLSYFKGIIDDVRVYNRALDVGELKGHYDKPAAVKDVKSEKGLAGYWSFDTGPETGKNEAIKNAGLEPEYRKMLEPEKK